MYCRARRIITSWVRWASLRPISALPVFTSLIPQSPLTTQHILLHILLLRALKTLSFSRARTLFLSRALAPALALALSRCGHSLAHCFVMRYLPSVHESHLKVASAYMRQEKGNMQDSEGCVVCLKALRVCRKASYQWNLKALELCLKTLKRVCRKASS